MDIEHFYDANPRRRRSEEYSFGQDWTDAGGTRWELNWVKDTGEVYVMREAGEPLVIDPLGDSVVPDLPVSEVTVEILAVVEGLEELESRLAGWSEAMGEPGSLQWIRDRIAAEGGAEGQGGPTDPTAGSDPAPTRLEGA